MPKITQADWDKAADFVLAELERRKSNPKRKHREEQWREIDRQIAMKAKPVVKQQGVDNNWISNLELPWQADALEVIKADAKRLKFPPTTDWYKTIVNLTEDEIERAIGRPPLVEGAEQEQITPDDMAMVVKSTLDYFHQVYRFRDAIDRGDTEAIKYGTAAYRVAEVNFAQFKTDFRGVEERKTVGPAIIPVTIKNLYLDTTPTAVLHEGFKVEPSYIRTWSQNIHDLRNAAAKGGDGWNVKGLRALEAHAESSDRAKDHVELVEYEGDLILPRSGRDVTLPNVIVAVAKGNNAKVVRFRPRKYAFRSYIVQPYQLDDLDDPYGTSPLISGLPIQKSATMAFNRMVDAAALSTAPPLAIADDTKLIANGGPQIYPNARFEVEDVENIKPFKIGEIDELLQMFIAFKQAYEERTGVNAPRRGQGAKSHTTAFSTEVETTRGLLRTEDFVVGQEEGMLLSMLYMEYEILKKSLRKTTVPISERGEEGFVTLSKEDLPSQAEFKVFGSAGAARARDQLERFFSVQDRHIALVGAAIQAGIEAPKPDIRAMIEESYKQAGIENSDRFIGADEAPPQPVEGAPGVPQPAAPGPQGLQEVA